MPEHNAKDILVEALDTIKATYWIQGQEAAFAMGSYHGDGNWTWEEWDALEKAIPAVPDTKHFSIHEGIKGNDKDGKVKVTGVCSIGALALANVTLYDEPLTRWYDIVTRDFETWKASQALSMTLLTSEPRLLEHNSAGDIIASWNDEEDRTRKDVIKAFTKALESPLLAAEKVYQLVYTSDWGTNTVPVFFASEEAAHAFLATPSELFDRACDYLGADGLEVAEFIFDTQPAVVA